MKCIKLDNFILKIRHIKLIGYLISYNINEFRTDKNINQIFVNNHYQTLINMLKYV